MLTTLFKGASCSAVCAFFILQFADCCIKLNFIEGMTTITVINRTANHGTASLTYRTY
jgi:hypothetical protein